MNELGHLEERERRGVNRLQLIDDVKIGRYKRTREKTQDRRQLATNGIYQPAEPWSQRGVVASAVDLDAKDLMS